ncbi:MAG: DUF4234 domain-containing protein [Actinomycetota bacterium]|nr:DUF4234 domain-containing protein [Actinomycetota bacterium]
MSFGSARGSFERHSPTAAGEGEALAQEVQIAGAGATAKIRDPIAVAVLSFVTLGIYVVFYWYFINRELADYGRARGTAELGDNPALSTLALFPGALVVVPAVWTTVTTFKRVQAAQRLSGESPINGWLGLVLYLVLAPAFYGYIQSGLNGVWRSQAARMEAEPANP